MLRKVIFSLIVCLAISAPLLILPKSASAAIPTCDSLGIILGANNLNGPIYYYTPYTFQITVSGPGITPNIEYGLSSQNSHYANLATSTGNLLSFTENATAGHYWVNTTGRNTLFLTQRISGQVCELADYTVVTTPLTCEYLHAYQIRGTTACYGGSGGCISNEAPSTIIVEAKIVNGTTPYTENIEIKLKNNNEDADHIGNGVHRSVFTGTHDIGPEPITVRTRVGMNQVICTGSVTVSGNCNGQCMTTPADLGINAVVQPSGTNLPYQICDQIDQTQSYLQDAYENCIECVEDGGGSSTDPRGIWTAIGCIPRDPTSIVQNLLRVGLGMGGGVALLMGLVAGFLFATSQGDPKRTGEAKELLTGAITGLLFIIFSVVILQFIGYTVLKIPGFGG